jgi:hypothetical protein
MTPPTVARQTERKFVAQDKISEEVKNNDGQEEDCGIKLRTEEHSKGWIRN